MYIRPTYLEKDSARSKNKELKGLHTADYRDCTLVINIIPKNLKPESNLLDKY